MLSLVFTLIVGSSALRVQQESGDKSLAQVNALVDEMASMISGENAAPTLPTQSMIQDLFTRVTGLMTCEDPNAPSSTSQATCGAWSSAAQQNLNTKLTDAVAKI